MSTTNIFEQMADDASIDACISAACQKHVAQAMSGTAIVRALPVAECVFNLPSIVVAPAELKLSTKTLVCIPDPARLVLLAGLVGINIYRTGSIDTDENFEVVLQALATDMVPADVLELIGETVAKWEVAAVVTMLANRWNDVFHEVFQITGAQDEAWFVHP